MPPINTRTGVDTSGYIPESQVAAPPPSAQALPEKPLLPTRSSILRFSAPYLPGTFPSSDTLTGFHLGSLIPQFRVPVPAPVQAGGAGTSTTTFASTSSSSSTTTNNPPTAKTAPLVTPVLSPNESYFGILTMAKSFVILNVTVGTAARIQFYSTQEAQTLDASRPVTVGPGFGTNEGIVGDIVLTSAPYIWNPSEMIGYNADNPQTSNCYITLTNLSSSAVAVTLNATFVPLQS